MSKKKHTFIRSGSFVVYMLRCSDGSYYTGHTHDIAARLKLHRAGKGSKYVRSRLPVRLVYLKEFSYFKHAFSEEFRVKALTRKDKKKLISSYRSRRRKQKGIAGRRRA